jgi:hypothetical protein
VVGGTEALGTDPGADRGEHEQRKPEDGSQKAHHRSFSLREAGR